MTTIEAIAPTRDRLRTRRGVAAPQPRKVKESGTDRALTIVITAVLIGAILAILYPLYFIVIASVSEPNEILNGNVWLWPRGLTFDGFRAIFSDPAILRGFGNSLLYTMLATAYSVSIILGGAYALSRKDLPARKLIMLFFVITMFIDGGMIARYLVVQNLGLLNTIWAVVLPGGVGVWNLIIARSFFESNIPSELRDAAQIDGANDFRFFVKIVLPLSKPLIALMIMIHLVGNWNAWFDALIFLKDQELFPLQLVLRNILVQTEVNTAMGGMDGFAAAQRLGELIRYGMIVVSSAPLLIALPFMQKHFVKGALLGAVKS